MGLRFRKSLNLGKGFKLNLSKSGIGYSFGFKGFRIGKTAKGKTRKTISLPGTGLSYQTETKEDTSVVKDSATSSTISSKVLSLILLSSLVVFFTIFFTILLSSLVSV